jgi:periplasmic protein TonB
MKNTRLRLTDPVLIVSAIGLLLVGCTSSAQDMVQKTSDVVYAVGNGVTAPKLVYVPNPEYTEKARKEKIRGFVVLSMVVTAEGTVRDPHIAASLTEDLDQQALAAVSIWKFKPATKDGKPVAVRIKTSITFNLY